MLSHMPVPTQGETRLELERLLCSGYPPRNGRDPAVRLRGSAKALLIGREDGCRTTHHEEALGKGAKQSRVNGAFNLAR